MVVGTITCDTFKQRVEKWIAVMPRPPKSGDANLDNERDAQYTILADTVKSAMMAPLSILGLHKQWKEFERNATHQFHPDASPDEQLTNISVFGALDSQVMINALATRIDASATELQVVCNKATAIEELFEE